MRVIVVPCHDPLVSLHQTYSNNSTNPNNSKLKPTHKDWVFGFCGITKSTHLQSQMIGSRVDHDDHDMLFSDNSTLMAFFKCTRWQEEIISFDRNCLYHYSCESNYNGDYPSAVDFLVLSFTIMCYLLTLFFTVIHVKRGHDQRQPRRCLLVSGPILLPIILLIMSNGNRINTIFPLSHMGPVLLQLVHVSALAFDNQTERSVRYAVLESSTASGVLHASLHLDYIILPYYTGLDAFLKSSFSGECQTCICRGQPLVIGGTLVSYRGWSPTAFSVVGTLCSRMACGLFGEDKMMTWIKFAMEGVGWILLLKDCVDLMVDAPLFGSDELWAHGAVCVLILLHMSRKICNILGMLEPFCRSQKKRELILDDDDDV